MRVVQRMEIEAQQQQQTTTAFVSFDKLSFTGVETSKGTEKDAERLNAANELARESIAAIKDVLDRIGQESVQLIAKQIFYDDSSETLGEIKRILGLAEAGLKSGGIEFQFGAVFAFSKYKSGKLCLNRQQFNRRYLIHEATHLFANTVDNYYLKSNLEPHTVKNAPQASTAINNADSFAMFVEKSMG